MKKWLNDLYSILLKRGYNTLDNSLKNYETLDKQITKEVQSGLSVKGTMVSYNLFNYDSEINDILLIKFMFSNGYVGIATAVHTLNGFVYLNTLGVSPNMTISIYNNGAHAVNRTDEDLEYSLYINTI